MATDEQFSEQIKTQEQEEKDRYDRESRKRHENPLGEEHLRRQIPGYPPESDEQKEKRQAANRAELAKEQDHVGPRSLRDIALAQNIGHRVRIHLKNRAPMISGRLADIDWEFATLKIEGRAKSPPVQFFILMRDILRLEILP